MQNLQKKCLFLKNYFVSRIFPRLFKIINVQEDPRNNKSIESGLTAQAVEGLFLLTECLHQLTEEAAPDILAFTQELRKWKHPCQCTQFKRNTYRHKSQTISKYLLHSGCLSSDSSHQSYCIKGLSSSWFFSRVF